jgi:hypothetical protein
VGRTARRVPRQSKLDAHLVIKDLLHLPMVMHGCSKSENPGRGGNDRGFLLMTVQGAYTLLAQPVSHLVTKCTSHS